MNKRMPLKLDAGDVHIYAVNTDCTECGENPVECYVVLDFRNNGEEAEVFRGCTKCCKRFAARLKESLPSDEVNQFSLKTDAPKIEVTFRKGSTGGYRGSIGTLPATNPLPDSRPDCGICGNPTVFVRGRDPQADRREVCPTCMAERLDSISELAASGFVLGPTYSTEST